MLFEILADNILLAGKIIHAVDNYETRPGVIVEATHHAAERSTGGGADFQMCTAEIFAADKIPQKCAAPQGSFPVPGYPSNRAFCRS
ncbi:MAG: hypothetical protein R3C12_14155 [Planctomycetaceae bacterium]